MVVSFYLPSGNFHDRDNLQEKHTDLWEISMYLARSQRGKAGVPERAGQAHLLPPDN